MAKSEAEKLAMDLLTGRVKDMTYLSPPAEMWDSVFFAPPSGYDDYSGEVETSLINPEEWTLAGDVQAAAEAVKERDALATALAALSFAVPGTIRPVGKAAAAYAVPEAVKLAQRRVVEPLGALGDDAVEVAISDAAREAFTKELVDPALKIQQISSPAGYIKIMEDAKFSPAQNSIYSWYIDDAMRGQGHGADLLDRALADYAELGAQASSPKAVQILFDRGFANPDMPNATLKDLLEMQREASSVYLQKGYNSKS